MSQKWSFNGIIVIISRRYISRQSIIQDNLEYLTYFNDFPQKALISIKLSSISSQYRLWILSEGINSHSTVYLACVFQPFNCTTPLRRNDILVDWIRCSSFSQLLFELFNSCKGKREGECNICNFMEP